MPPRGCLPPRPRGAHGPSSDPASKHGSRDPRPGSHPWLGSGTAPVTTCRGPDASNRRSHQVNRIRNTLTASVCQVTDGSCRCIRHPVCHARSRRVTASEGVALRPPLLASILALTLLLPGPLHSQEAPASEIDVVTAPVELDGEILFRVRGVSSLPAAERAKRIREQIVAVAKDPSVGPDSLHVVEMEAASQLQAGNHPLMVIVDADAALEQVRRVVLAQAHLRRVQQAIRDYRAERTREAVQDAVRQLLIAMILLSLAILAIVWAGRFVDRALSWRLRSRIHSVGIQSFEVVRAEKLWDALRGALMVARTVALLTVVFLFLGYVLALFPATRGLSRNM